MNEPRHSLGWVIHDAAGNFWTGKDLEAPPSLAKVFGNYEEAATERMQFEKCAGLLIREFYQDELC